MPNLSSLVSQSSRVVTSNDPVTLTNKTIEFGNNTLVSVASTDDNQTLTNKTITFGDNTLTDVASTNTSQTLTNKTIDGPVFNNDSEFNGTVTLQDVNEKFLVDTSTSGTLDFNCVDQGIVYLTDDQTADRTINFRGDGSTTFDSYLDVGETVTVVVLFTNGSTAYSFTTFEIDGTTVTPLWQGGSAPSGGNADSIDSYSFTIIKTASATYTVLGSQTQFA